MNDSGLSRRDGFSLVEVTIALGIAVFVLVSLMGLASVAFRSMSDSGMKLEAASVASEISARWRSILLWNSDPDSTSTSTAPSHFPIPVELPVSGGSLASSGILVTRQGLVAADDDDKRFRLSYEITRSTLNPKVVLLYLRLTWPAGAVNSLNGYEIMTSAALGARAP